MANARMQFDTTASYLLRRHERVRMGIVAGRQCLLFDGKPFMLLYRQSVAFRLSGRALTHTLALSGASGFDPLKPNEPPPGKPGWVLVPETHWSTWNRCALEALHCVILAQSQHVSWQTPQKPPEPPPAAPPSTPKSLAERVAAILKAGFSFGLQRADH